MGCGAHCGDSVRKPTLIPWAHANPEHSLHHLAVTPAQGEEVAWWKRAGRISPLCFGETFRSGVGRDHSSRIEAPALASVINLTGGVSYLHTLPVKKTPPDITVDEEPKKSNENRTPPPLPPAPPMGPSMLGWLESIGANGPTTTHSQATECSC